MATQRYISTSFWDDEWIQTLDPSEKLLYLYFMTNPLTNISGIYKITDKRISFDTGFNIDTIRHIMDKFETAKKAYRIEEYIILPAWPKHQKWESRSKIKAGIDNCLNELPKHIYERVQEIGYRYPMKPYDTLSKGSNYSDTDSDIDSDIDNNTDTLNHPNKIQTFITEWGKHFTINIIDFTNRIASHDYLQHFDALSADEIKQAINNYAFCVNSTEYPFVRKGPPHKFLAKMIEYTESYDPINSKKDFNKTGKIETDLNEYED